MAFLPQDDESLALLRQAMRDPSTQSLMLALQPRPEQISVGGFNPLLQVLMAGTAGRSRIPWFTPGDQRVDLNYPLHQSLGSRAQPELLRTLGHESGHIAANLSGFGRGSNRSGIGML